MEIDCCTVVWLALIAGVLSRDFQSLAKKYQTIVDECYSSYPIRVQTPIREICSQECLQRGCSRFSYNSQTKECLLDDGTGEGLFNRSSGSLAYRSVNPLLARGKEVTHSVVFVSSSGYDYSGSKIVDGHYTPEESGLSESESLMILAAQQDPWFEIDLEDDFCIAGMTFWRRAGHSHH